MFAVESLAEGRKQGEAILDELVRDIQKNQHQWHDPNIAGVLLWGVLTYWSRRPPAYGYVWLRRSVANTRTPHAPETMDAIGYLLFELARNAETVAHFETVKEKKWPSAGH
jgi:hypothetical protein